MKTNDTITFSFEQFMEETSRLRALMGNKEFWAKPAEQRQKAVDGYGFCYVWLDPDQAPAGSDKANTAAMIYESTMNEYMRRECYALRGI